MNPAPFVTQVRKFITKLERARSSNGSSSSTGARPAGPVPTARRGAAQPGGMGPQPGLRQRGAPASSGAHVHETPDEDHKVGAWLGILLGLRSLLPVA